MHAPPNTVNELGLISAKLDMLMSMVITLRADVEKVLGQQEKPMTLVAFGKRVGLSRWAIRERIRRGEIITKRGRIPPAELRKFGL